jgi:DNA-binding response OmpR family regulator
LRSRQHNLARGFDPADFILPLELYAGDGVGGARRLPATASRSRSTSDSEREQAIATGCDEFDTKPIEFEGLIATIRRVLGKSKPR